MELPSKIKCVYIVMNGVAFETKMCIYGSLISVVVIKNNMYIESQKYRLEELSSKWKCKI